MNKEQYEAQIKALKEEIELLKKKQTYEIKRQKYGLNWIDVPEAFEKDSENKIPVLEEVKEKSIKNNDGKPTHILIEGDNYHALQCLNYTHKGKIDVIYIDPPYNTGKEFVYKDARFLDKYPDGSLVDSNHPLKHSYWLSFMEKRLKLAKNLLSEEGVIFISIDDNEFPNLLILCNQIFEYDNFICNFVWTNNEGGGGSDSKFIKTKHEYIVCFCKNIKKFATKNVPIEDEERYKLSDKYENIRGKYQLVKLSSASIQYSKSLDYPIEMPDGTIVNPVDNSDKNRSCWRWSKKKLEWGLQNDFVVFKKNTKGEWQVYTKQYINCDKDGNICKRTKIPLALIDKFSSTQASNNLIELMNGKFFSYPKPYQLIEWLIERIPSSSSTILDFFAGSGTTLHATMKLNEEDGGNRQCILVQLNENNICEEVTYERNRRVMQGYTNSKGEQIPGLGNSLKYYKTAFIGQNNCKNANDDDRTELAKKAGCLLSLGENTLDEICSTEYYQLFTGSKEATAVYFTDDYEKFDEFKEKVAELAPKFKKTFVYIFAWSSADDFAYEFEDIPNIQIKAIPLPILEIYKSIYN